MHDICLNSKLLNCLNLKLFLLNSYWEILHNQKSKEFTAYRNSWTLDAGARRWTLEAGRWTLDAGLRMLDAGPGRWNLDAECYILDTGLWKRNNVVDCFRIESEPSFSFCLIKLLKSLWVRISILTLSVML